MFVSGNKHWWIKVSFWQQATHFQKMQQWKYSPLSEYNTQYVSIWTNPALFLGSKSLPPLLIQSCLASHLQHHTLSFLVTHIQPCNAQLQYFRISLFLCLSYFFLMSPACLSHVSLMSLACLSHVSLMWLKFSWETSFHQYVC